MHEEGPELRPILGKIERALLDLQGPLDTLALLADTLPPPQAAPVTWLVDTAASSTARLKEEWEKLHDIVRSAEGGAGGERKGGWACADDGPASGRPLT